GRKRVCVPVSQTDSHRDRRLASPAVVSKKHGHVLSHVGRVPPPPAQNRDPPCACSSSRTVFSSRGAGLS
ncbi:unnamed protein product, partial [Arctogadus glacialis]